MINIPTELLRTLIAVVDMRSFTKAAQFLGVTQPAVSAQIKRLQSLLGADLLDKSAPGVSLTPAGEATVSYGRRMLTINDQILDLTVPAMAGQLLRIGLTGDFAGPVIARSASQLHRQKPDTCFVYQMGHFESLLRDLREGELDILLSISTVDHHAQPHLIWKEKLAWVGAAPKSGKASESVPLIFCAEECGFQHAAMTALHQANLKSHVVAVTPGMSVLCGLLSAGMGVTVLPLSRVADFPTLEICDEAHWPELPDVSCAIYVREGAGRQIRETFADRLVTAWNGESAAMFKTGNAEAIRVASPAA